MSIRIAIICLVFVILPLPLVAQRIDSISFKLGQGQKVSPLLKTNHYSGFNGKLRILVTEHSGFKRWILETMPDLKFHQTEYKNIYEISGVQISRINTLLGCQFIDFVDLSDRKALEERSAESFDLSVNKVTPVHEFFPLFSGEGLSVSIKERPFDTTDLDLRGRVIKTDFPTGPATLHATFMATFIAGAGNSSPEGKGAAWKSQITSSTFTNLLPDDGQKLTSLNVSVQNHSYGVNQIENYYGIETMEYDKHCSDYPNIVHVFSSGNLGQDTCKTGLYAGIPKFANLSGQFKMSKNTISVGATDLYGNIAELSSRGPAYDGRIKPELVAYGAGGTSDAAALVSGICLLVQDAYKLNNNGNLPTSSLVKSVIINSADDTGRPGIDFESGFGSIDANGAVKTIVENRFINSSLSDGEEKVFNIPVPVDAGSLKVTLAWCDPEAAINASTALVNDLDLEVIQTSTGNGWKPWVLSHFPNVDSLVLPATRMADHLNNVELVTLSFPEGGNYELHIKGLYIKTDLQEFSLSYEFESGFEWIYPLKTSQLESGKKMQVRWQYSGADETVSPEYLIVGSNEWKLAGTDINLSKSYFDWSPPDTNALAVIRIKTGSQEFLTDTFTISKSIILKVAYNCDDEALINWEPVSGINEYTVYQVGENYTEPFTIIADTFLILDELDMQNYFYAVSPIIGEKEGLRGNTINYASSGVGCYIVSFFAKYYVTDTVLLDLTLASNYRLKSASLERLTNDEYVKIQTIEPVTNLQMTFEDLNPRPSRNLYRVCLERDDHKLIYSDEVELFFNQVNSLLVFPNPVSANSELNVINGDELPVKMNLYDYAGKLLYGYDSGPAAVKVFPIKDIGSGLYILEVINQDSFKTGKTIVIFNPK